MNEQLKIIISAEIDKLKQNLEEAKSQVQTFGDKAKTAFKNFGDTAQKGMKVAGTALKVVGGAVGSVVTGMVGLVKGTEQYRENQAKLTTAFESAGASASTATEVYNGLYRVLGDDDVAVEASAHLAQLTTDQASLSEWTNICQGVYATFGDSLPIESLTEASNETAKTGQLTGALADALNWAGINEEEFQSKIDACNTEAEREALIRKTLNGVYDDASKKYEENNKAGIKQKETQAKLQSALAKLGTTLAPIITKFTELAVVVLEKASPYIQKFADWILPKIKPAFDIVVNVIKTAIDWIKKIIQWVKDMGDKFVNAWNRIKEAFGTMVSFFGGIWDGIKNIFSNIGTAIANAIKGAVSSAVNRVLSTAIGIINGFISAINFAIGIINAIPGVNIRKLDKLNVPQMAKGGIVDSATLAMIGENGKEAVVPLENNLEWLDKLAGMLNERMGGNQPIVLQVDGKTFAQITCDSINSLTRQRGSIPLNFA